MDVFELNAFGIYTYTDEVSFYRFNDRWNLPDDEKKFWSPLLFFTALFCMDISPELLAIGWSSANKTQ